MMITYDEFAIKVYFKLKHNIFAYEDIIWNRIFDKIINEIGIAKTIEYLSMLYFNDDRTIDKKYRTEFFNINVLTFLSMYC